MGIVAAKRCIPADTDLCLAVFWICLLMVELVANQGHWRLYRNLFFHYG